MTKLPSGSANMAKRAVRARDEVVRFNPRNFPRYIPDRLPCTLRTSFTLTYALASGNSYFATSVINSNDVRTAITGNQPMDRDQLYTLYLGCRCYGFRITVHGICTTSGQGPRLALAPATSGVADTNIDATIERKGAKFGYPMFGAPPLRLSVTQGVTDALALPDSAISDLSFLQPTGSDLPVTTVAYYQLNASNVTLAATANVFAEVMLEQFVVFQDLVQNTVS